MERCLRGWNGKTRHARLRSSERGHQDIVAGKYPILAGVSFERSRFWQTRVPRIQVGVSDDGGESLSVSRDTHDGADIVIVTGSEQEQDESAGARLDVSPQLILFGFVYCAARGFALDNSRFAIQCSDDPVRPCRSAAIECERVAIGEPADLQACIAPNFRWRMLLSAFFIQQSSRGQPGFRAGGLLCFDRRMAAAHGRAGSPDLMAASVSFGDEGRRPPSFLTGHR